MNLTDFSRRLHAETKRQHAETSRSAKGAFGGTTKEARLVKGLMRRLAK